MSKLEKFARSQQHMRLHKWSNYFEVYEKYLSKFIGKGAKIIHIGEDMGTAQMLVEYLKDCQVFIIANDPSYVKYDSVVPNTRVLHGSVDDLSFVHQLETLTGEIDVVIDGGDHINSKQIAAFKHFYGWLKWGGVYIVEATHTSYWQHYGGGLKHPGSFTEFSKSLVDYLHEDFIHHPLNDDPVKVEKTPIPHLTDHIAFYNSILVIQKKRAPVANEIILSGDDNYQGAITEIEGDLPEEKLSVILNKYDEVIRGLRDQVNTSERHKNSIEDELNQHKELIQRLEDEILLVKNQKEELEAIKDELSKRADFFEKRSIELHDRLVSLEEARDTSSESTPKKKKIAKLFKLGKKSDQAKDDQAKDDQAKDDQAKDDQAKDDQAKDDQAKDDQAKDDQSDTPSEKKRKGLSKLLRLSKRKGSDTEDESTESESSTPKKKSLANLFKRKA